MAKRYNIEFQTMIVNLLKSGRSFEEVSVNYSLSEVMIRGWYDDYNRAKSSTVLTPEQKKIAQLKAELKKTKLEVEILKAASIFSKRNT